MNARLIHILPCLAMLAFIVGCERNEMHRQARVDPLESSDFFADGRASRNPPPGTVARGHLETDHAFYQGKDASGKLVDTFPFPVTLGVLQRGQQRFDIYCSVCHGYQGDGNGMIVQRGMIRPPSYHIDRLRNVAVGHFYDVITNGYGAMYSYADRISPRDRWAIVAYIKALQLSQHYPTNKLTADQQAQVNMQSEKTPQ
ncbi:MAG TPA: cytochrome c [Tepidisphaeraceae bacterium]|jgi:cytochrome c553